ncbi:hypothetical protein [Pseudomonas sp. 22 E 5]|nr:hypothetical protein [Pseudomonas sp. 22 E 5]
MALVDKTFAQAARKFLGGALREVTVIRIRFAREQHVQDVVEVVVPLRIKVVREQAGLVEFVFQYQPHVPAGVHLLAYPMREFF